MRDRRMTLTLWRTNPIPVAPEWGLFDTQSLGWALSGSQLPMVDADGYCWWVTPDWMSGGPRILKMNVADLEIVDVGAWTSPVSTSYGDENPALAWSFLDPDPTKPYLWGVGHSTTFNNPLNPGSVNYDLYVWRYNRTTGATDPVLISNGAGGATYCATINGGTIYIAYQDFWGRSAPWSYGIAKVNTTTLGVTLHSLLSTSDSSDFFDTICYDPANAKIAVMSEGDTVYRIYDDATMTVHQSFDIAGSGYRWSNYGDLGWANNFVSSDYDSPTGTNIQMRRYKWNSSTSLYESSILYQVDYNDTDYAMPILAVDAANNRYFLAGNFSNWDETPGDDSAGRVEVRNLTTGALIEVKQMDLHATPTHSVGIDNFVRGVSGNTIYFVCHNYKATVTGGGPAWYYKDRGVLYTWDFGGPTV